MYRKPMLIQHLFMNKIKKELGEEKMAQLLKEATAEIEAKIEADKDVLKSSKSIINLQ